MTTERADLLVVGAGPAGLAAAVTAALGGLRVTLLDAGPGLGGQYWRHPAPGAARELRSSTRRYHHDLRTYAALTDSVARLAERGALAYRPNHQVWTAAVSDGTSGGFVAHAVDRGDARAEPRARRYSGSRLLVATGAYDRQLPFEGWDLPGVFSAGGLQALLKGNGARAGSRVVIGGTGPFLLPVAVGLAQAGAEVAAVCEASSGAGWLRQARALAGVPGKLVEGAEYAADLARYRIAVRPRTAIIAARGDRRVEEVTTARLSADGAVVPGSQRTLVADTVGVGWGFAPQLDLALTLGCEVTGSADGNEVVVVDAGQRTSVPGVSAAGEVCGVGGAVLALREGQLAAEAVLADSGREPVTGAADLERVRRLVAAHRAFATAMHTAHPLPPRWGEQVGDDATVCRCEEVTAGAVRAAVDEGAGDARQVKQLTRAGMGWCQGRMCAAGVECLVRSTRPDAPSAGAPLRMPASERLVTTPVPLRALVAESDA